MNKSEILFYLSAPDIEGELFHKADKVRKEYCGEEVHIRGIIEFSNYCCRNCLYCGLRRDNKVLSRYRMEKEEIVKLAHGIIEKGVKTIVLQSGDDFYYSSDDIAWVIEKIKKKGDVAVTLSLGERPIRDYKKWKEAGADRYLLKHETANPALYRKLHPGQCLERRIKILLSLKELGYQIGAGNIVGLPGQTVEDLAEDVLLLEKLDVDMAGIGPFIPQKNTPLGNSPPGDINLTLRVLSLTRILTRNAHLPATTALATLDPERGQLMALKAGANVIMPDFTPENCREKYVIYDDKARVTLERAKELIMWAGRRISTSRGDSLKRNVL
ncbi:MAG: [FeFe] hydrogenase H-cluster radical SAM maturase HydE [Candidatus Latescibacterota bacterium]|nr:MAG: [FeFe] hydrogenase H-cluster radical SAM maturase HydE [Candidatus Latescibacterota bacterium]